MKWATFGLPALASFASFALGGCALAGSMNVEPVAVSSEKPGNVALFVAVSQHGSAVVGLDKQAFKVYENDVALDSDQIQLTLLPTASAASERVAVLVDMSKTVGAQDKQALSQALRSFLVRLRQREAVSLYAFDGSEKVHLVADYAKDARAEADEKDTSMDRLLAFSRRDSSSSLYTAVMDGAQKLGAQLAVEGRPIQSGTLIVIALNPDLAGRVDDGKVRDFVASSPYHYYLVTVGPWATSADVSFLGKNGAARAASLGTVTTPLETIATAVEDDYHRKYLVSYCSPSRAGTRTLRLEVSTTDERGRKSLGRYDTEFDASGFGPGCNPLALPQFVVAKAKDTSAQHVAANGAGAPSTKPAPKTTVAANGAGAPSAKPVPKATAPAPAADAGEKVSSSSAPAAKPSASASAPIAEPPRGLGYE